MMFKSIVKRRYHFSKFDSYVMRRSVEENTQLYTRREVEGAERARELLARMGYLSVKQTIEICATGKNSNITVIDFQIADAIYGRDIASRKGNTRKKETRAAEGEIGAVIA